MVVSIDYAFQFKTSGILLNGNNNIPTVGNPIYDIYSVEGLDMTPMQVSTKNYEGMDGGYVEARYLKIRTVTLSGVLIAHKDDSLEALLDGLKNNFRPLVDEDYLYFKAPGVVERKLGCKPTSFTYSWDQSRRFNSCTFQVIFQAQDPVIYSVAHKSVTPASGSTVTVNNAGNAYVPPFVTITGANTNVWISNITTDERLKFTYTQAAGDRLFVDHKKHTAFSQVIATGVYTNRRSTLFNEEWWRLGPGNIQINVGPASGTPTILFEWDDGWL